MADRRSLLALVGLAAVSALAPLVVMSGASPRARNAPVAAHVTPQSALRADVHNVVTPDGSAPPFVLTASAPERARATLCMAEAVYYEAALEPTEGQQAVAQTVLNRVRHPNFPKSVCGVVYEGARAPGCEFSFACDGSRERPPIEPYWSRAEAVAKAALNGYVDKSAGAATYYHADYVYPVWAPQLVKIGQFGSQLFYRFPGPLGAAQALTGRYGGGELAVSTAGPPVSVILAMHKAAAPQNTPSPATGVAMAPAPSIAGASGVMRARVAGEIVFGRRIPSKDEIAQVNAQIGAATADDPKTRIADLTAETPATRPSGN